MMLEQIVFLAGYYLGLFLFTYLGLCLLFILITLPGLLCHYLWRRVLGVFKGKQ